MQAKRDTLIVGAGSSIGASLTRHLGPRAVAVSRRPCGHSREILVGDYGALPSRAFDGIRQVINCVGVVSGPREVLDAINVALPSRIAAAAHAADVEQFVHVSSFSVYGDADRVDRTTIASPTDGYGRSKLAGDLALLALAKHNFAVATLRLPLVYALDGKGKLAELFHIWRRLRVLPIPRNDISRSMIAAGLAAEVIAHLIEQPPSGGVMFAADPQPFRYKDAAHARPEALFTVPIPTVLISTACRFVPAHANRLFTDSRLAADDNLALSFGLSSRLYQDISLL